MYIYSIIRNFYIKNTNITIIKTPSNDNNEHYHGISIMLFHLICRKILILKQYCKYIISMKFIEPNLRKSNFLKCKLYENVYLCASLSARADLPSPKL